MIAFAVNTVGEAIDSFGDHWLVYLSMPIVGGFIGWITKVLAIEMIFHPIEFKGIGPIGWQGQLPRRAAKFGSHATDLILEQLLDPRMLVDQLDPDRMAEELDEVMLATVDDVARDLIGERWDQLPPRARALVITRARARSPKMIANLLDQAKANIDDLFDLSYIVVSNLIRDKRLLNELVRGTIEPEARFMKRFGTIFGAAVGAIQMVVFAFTESHLLIPLFGLGVGLVSDYIALQMIFRPIERKRYFGLFEWQGMFFARREEFAAEYAKLGAEKVLTPSVVMESLLDGPLSERLFAMVQYEVNDALDEELGVLGTVAPAAIGSARYNELRETVVGRIRERVPAAAARIEPYAAEALDIERTARESLKSMSDEEYEGMLRPVFKEDEWLVVVVGGGLGFAVGELQVQLLIHLGGL